MAGCAHDSQSRDASQSQSFSPDSTTEPSLQSAAVYQIPTTKQIAEVLERIRERLDTASSPRFIDRKTKHEVTDLSTPMPDLEPDPGSQRKFNPISYEMGVVHTGMLNAAEATSDARFSWYTTKWLQFFADNLPALAKWPKGTLAQPASAEPVTAAATQEAAAKTDRAESGRPGHRDGTPRIENPFRALLAPASLDDCGAMTSAMIEARMASIGPDLKPVIDRAIDFVSNRQFRLADGTFARHRPVRDSVWADDMYMGVSILIQAGRMTGNTRYFDDAARQVLQIGQRLYVPDEKLFTHGWNSVNPNDHPTYCWGRANGWCMMAMAELLTVLPEDHPDRAAVLDQFRAVARGVASVQGGDGLWHQMLDRTDSYTETSCSAMFVFAIARGVNHGWLDFATYGPVAVVGWNGLASRVDNRGHIAGTCIGTTYANDYFYYYHRPSTDDVHGYGPTLLAGAEMIHLMNNPRFFSTKSFGPGQIQFIARPAQGHRSATQPNSVAKEHSADAVDPNVHP
jgi:unsaturated rhamnogalacturonyl hydrolase